MVRPEPDGGQDGPPAGYVDVDVDSLAEAAEVLADMATRLRTATDQVVPPAIDVLAALPQSDLYSAYAFCWGRWSNVLESATVAVDACARVAREAATGYRHTDRRLAE
jgi:hypothetical protein